MYKCLILIISLALAACAPMVWVKPGAAQNDFSSDKYSCTQQAQQRVSSANVNAYGGTANNNVITNENIYNSCMNSKGWYLKTQEVAQRQVQNQQSNVQQAKARLDQITKESKDSCDKDEYKIISVKSTCRADDLTLEQLSDSTKISPKDKPSFMSLYSDSRARGKRVIAAYRSAGDPVGLELANLVGRTETKHEKNSLDLYEGKVSWGEYNKTRKEIGSSYREEYNAIAKKK